MFQIRNLSYQIAGNFLFENVNWMIGTNRRIALIGPNGAGKTTMLRIINGDLTPESGEMIHPRQYRIGYLPQEEVHVGKGELLSVVLAVHTDLRQVETEILDIRARIANSESENTTLLDRLAELEHQFDLYGGHSMEAEAKKVLIGLGFSEKDFARPVTEFSGGWQMRAFLARLLILKPDLLLLDEPTNHLDLPSLEWLETYLMNFRGSMIFVSHDRFFIDRLAQEISELELRKLTHYAGNYHFYEQQKELVREQLMQKAEQLREERERITRFIERFRYKNTKAVQVQSRIKMLEKMETIEIPPEQRDLAFRIEAPVKSFKDVLNIQDMRFRYDQAWVLKDLNIRLYRGEKVALVGVNGAGKTTLTKLLAQELTPSAGKIEIGERVAIGYYAQHQIDALNLDNTIEKEVMDAADPQYRTRVRDVLGMFQLSGDDIQKQIRVLSGGEKARVSLAKILVSPVNFLIMDEPTNHLDLRSKQALERALRDYDGTLLLISHDRYFLDKLVSRVFELQEGTMTGYEGNYSDYLNIRQNRIIKSSAVESKADFSDKVTRKEQKRLEAEARQQISAQRKLISDRISKTEQQIDHMESEKQELESAMSEPGFYKDEQRAAESGKRYQELQKLLPELYNSWEADSQELEQLLKKLPDRTTQ